jgi:hypothetical protein
LREASNVKLQDIQNILGFQTINAPLISISAAEKEKYLPPHLRGPQMARVALPEMNQLKQDSGQAAHSRQVLESNWRDHDTGSHERNISKSDYGAKQKTPKEIGSHGHRHHHHHREKPEYADGIPADVKIKLMAVSMN